MAKKKLIQLDWIKYGEMNGTNEGVMKSLLVSLPKTASIGPDFQLHVAHDYMAELWLRGVTKEDFIDFIEWSNDTLVVPE